MKISNINTLSALIDRLITERIKCFFFNKDNKLDKVEHQEKVISAIKKELSILFMQCYNTKNYTYLSEERTFDENAISESLDELIQADINIGESDRARLAQVESNEPNINSFLVNEKRLRKGNETRASKKNEIDKQFSDMVKGLI